MAGLVKGPFQHYFGSRTEETITEEPKDKKSRKNGSDEDNAKSKATDMDVDQSIRKALR